MTPERGSWALSDDSLFREVDEDVRREQMEKLWKRYGNLFVAACIGVVAGVAGIKGYQYWDKQRSESAGTAYVAAMQQATDGKIEDAAKAFEAVEQTGHGGYAVLARMQQAGLLAEQGKREEAVKAFDAIVADSSTDAALKDLARVRAAYLLASDASPEDLKKRLAGLDVPGSAWRASAREILALAEYRAGNLSAADKLLSSLLSDPATPAGMRQRAQRFSALLKPRLDGGDAASQ